MSERAPGRAPRRSRRSAPPQSRRSATTSEPDLNATAASLLGFLEKEPMTGWDLMVAAEDVIGDFWNVTRSQVYRELKVLAEQGLVTTMKAGPRDKQPYKITAAGSRAFRAWIAREPGVPNMRIPLVLSVFFGDFVPFDDLRRSAAKLRAHHVERLAAYRGFEEKTEKGGWPHEALRLGIQFQEVMIAWIDSLPKRPPSSKRR